MTIRSSGDFGPSSIPTIGFCTL